MRVCSHLRARQLAWTVRRGLAEHVRHFLGCIEAFSHGPILSQSVLGTKQSKIQDPVFPGHPVL